jgi:hypothetical protein
MNREAGGIPGPSPITIDPRTGKLTTNDAVNPQVGPLAECDRDRLRLAQVDNEQQFYRMVDEANRANASFYPVDPRGLVVFDSPIGPNPPLPPQVDAAILRTRQNSLRTLAEATDGLALVNTNQIAVGFKRIVTDLSSYYLLGYYASNLKMDGRFHRITVRVTRPGVQVRARRGYLAPTEAELNAPSSTSSGVPADSASAAAAAEAAAIETALGSLGGFSRELPRVRLPDPPNAMGAVFVRRSPLTGNKDVATADLRFRRSERLRVDVPAIPTSATSPVARLLDRNGRLMAIPVTAGMREETDGSFWVSAQLALAPLAVGDYLIELRTNSGGNRTLLAFRVVP